MKIVWIILGLTFGLLLAFAGWFNYTTTDEVVASTSPQTYSDVSRNGGHTANTEDSFFNKSYRKAGLKPTAIPPKEALPDSIVDYGLALMGTPYMTAGITKAGFDRSGFISYIFNKYNVKLPHSSYLLAKEGVSIPLKAARKGDLLIFTGTNKADPTPGHVGVVLTNSGQPVEFVHSSSVGGVKISKVAGTGYARRFIEARRVL